MSEYQKCQKIYTSLLLSMDAIENNKNIGTDITNFLLLLHKTTECDKFTNLYEFRNNAPFQSYHQNKNYIIDKCLDPKSIITYQTKSSALYLFNFFMK